MLHRSEIGLAALLAAAVTVAVIAAGRARKPPPLDDRVSTFLSGPEGSKAVHEVLARLGRPVERRRMPLFDLATNPARRPALLAVLAPELRLEPAELEQVVAYVRDGGHVIAAGQGGGITPCVGWWAGYPSGGGSGGGAFSLDSVPVVPPRPGLALPPVARVLELPPAEGRAALKRRLEMSSEDEECRRLVPRDRETLLETRDGRPVIVRLHYAGEGSVTLVADAGYFRNRVWRDTDVPFVMLPVLTPPPAPRSERGAIVWDEYHHGFGRGTSMSGTALRWLTAAPGGWAVLQLVAVALVWLAVQAVRFGPARSLIDVRRRSPLEHLEALAAGLESAAGADVAVRRIVAGLRRRLGRAGLPTPDARSQESWLATLELVVPTARGRDAVRRLQRLVTQPGGAERVLGAAQAVEDVWEDLRPRRTRDAF